MKNNRFDNATLRPYALSGAFSSAVEGHFASKPPFDCATLGIAWLRSGAIFMEQMFNVTGSVAGVG
jgi:hypothetical protein